MDGTVLLVASQAIVVAVAGTLIVLLSISTARRPVSGRAVLAVVATTGVLACGVAAAFQQTSLAGLLWFAVFPVLVACYPDGTVVPRWFVWPVLLSILAALADVATAGALSTQPWWPLFAMAQLLLIGGQIYRYRRRATTAEREAVRWAILGILLTVLAYGLLQLIDGGNIGGTGAWSAASANLALVPVMAGFAIGLLRPRSVNVDAVLRAVLAAVVALPLLALGYAGGVGAALALGATQAAAGWWGAAVVAALGYPVVIVGARFASWLVYSGRTDAATAVSRLGEALDAEGAPSAVSRVVLRTVVDALAIDGAELRGDGALCAQLGSVSAGAEEVPILYQGEELARLFVPPRRGESALTRHDRSVVTRIAMHAGPALHGARAFAELSDAHARLVLAREEERRRLRRDLHDDLSPTLSGLGLAAAAVSRRAAARDGALAAQADELRIDIQSAVTQLREIAYGLRPPILDDRGLVAAIRDRVNGQNADALLVEVRATGPVAELPAAVDLAALRIVQEAVANVRKHAAASRCTVTIAREAAVLRVSIEDDGIGMPAHIRPGLGLASIRDRAAELGGTASFGSRPGGGGRVSVSLPLATAAVDEVAR